ncbi:hypothetical protein Daus18300_014299 [Diaporthe australafricana]|uniref:CHAT domain-containing protein n=1 Tax=Diaporthe australafricana TaxID=127596 RepID=A0ABR3VVR8_9PEZI
MKSPGDPKGSLDGLKYYRELDNAIEETTPSTIEEAARRIPFNSDDPEFAPRLKYLVILLLRRFRWTADMDDLQQAILRAEEMIVASPPCHPERGARIEDWLDMMVVKWRRGGFQNGEIEHVIDMAQQVGKTMEVNSPRTFAKQINVPDGAISISGETMTAHWQGSITIQATSTTPAEYAAFLNLIHNEAMMSVAAGKRLIEKYNTTQSVDDLEKAIELFEKAVEHMSPDDPDSGLDQRSICLGMLGDAYGVRHQRTGSTRDLERSIELITDVINSLVDSPLVLNYLGHLAVSFSSLARWLGTRFDRFGSAEDLYEAINTAEMALNLTPPNIPMWTGLMKLLGTFLGERSEHDVSNEDLDRAIECLEMAVDAGASLSSDHQSVLLSDLGRLLVKRFTYRGSVKDLDRSVEMLEKATKMSPSTPFKCSLLHTFSLVLGTRYDHCGSDQDLDRAIELQRTVVDQTPEGHPDGAGHVGNLGLSLAKRAETSGSTKDIACSIDAIRAAINTLPKDHASQPTLLVGLGSALCSLSRKTSSMLDLEEAIEATREALCSVPPGLDLHTNSLHNLAFMLNQRLNYYYSRSSGTQGYSEAQSGDPFDEAIAIARLSIEATEEGHIARASRLANLGSLLQKRFIRDDFQNVDDINEAIEFMRQAVDSSSRVSRERAGHLGNLGIVLLSRYKMIGIAEDQSIALDCFKEGWASQNSPATFHRIDLAKVAAEILTSRSNWKESHHLLEEAVKLLPSVTPRSLQHTDKQQMLARFMGLASTAAAVALNAGKSAYDALKLLELGRGVIAGLLLDMRGDISDLKAQHPSLATAFLSLRDELDSPTDIGAFMNDARAIAMWEVRDRKLRESEKKLGELIGQIRSLSGFRHFCDAPDDVEVKAAAASGPIAVINVSPHRCDAFLIERDSIRVLELPDLTMEDVVQRHRAMRQSPAGPLADMAALLEWLWTSVTRPCLDALNFTTPISSADPAGWPRIWWIPTGPLSQFPLHAAGRHRQGGGETVLDRVMSSYALSLRTLIHGRRYCLPTGPVRPSNDRALLLAMPTTPGLERGGGLRWAQEEVNIVAKLCPELHLQKSTLEPRKDTVLDNLKSCKIFHFAGHGQSDTAKPSNSCLLLQDWQTSPLTVADFRDSRLQDQEARPFLGYLSACSTGANEAAELADEGIHLISSLQLAGFRHVIGTLWEVSDQHCVDVARVFYETLRDQGMTDEGVCQALHRATRALRNRSFNGGLWQRKAFCVDDGVTRRDLMGYHWVPYVHFGV